MMEEGQAHHTMKCQAPSLDRLEPCGERLDPKGERLAQDEGRLHKERLGGSLDRLGHGTFTHTWVKATVWKEKTLYMLHGGPLGVP